MPRELKLYSWTGFYPRDFADRPKNCTYFAVAPSKAEVYRLTGKKPHDFYEVSESGNVQAQEVAFAQPGVVFFWDCHNHKPGEWVAVPAPQPLS